MIFDTTALVLMLVIGVGCGLYLVTETVCYRDNIATLEAELGMSSLLSSSSPYSYSSSSSRAAVVKAGGGGRGGGGAGEEEEMGRSDVGIRKRRCCDT